MSIHKSNWKWQSRKALNLTFLLAMPTNSANTLLFRLHVVTKHKELREGSSFSPLCSHYHSAVFSMSLPILSRDRLYTRPALEKLASEMRFSLSP